MTACSANSTALRGPRSPFAPTPPAPGQARGSTRPAYRPIDVQEGAPPRPEPARDSPAARRPQHGRRSRSRPWISEATARPGSDGASGTTTKRSTSLASVSSPRAAEPNRTIRVGSQHLRTAATVFARSSRAGSPSPRFHTAAPSGTRSSRSPPRRSRSHGSGNPRAAGMPPARISGRHGGCSGSSKHPRYLREVFGDSYFVRTQSPLAVGEHLRAGPRRRRRHRLRP